MEKEQNLTQWVLLQNPDGIGGLVASNATDAQMITFISYHH